MKKDRTIRARITEDEYSILGQICYDENTTISEIVRDAIHSRFIALNERYAAEADSTERLSNEKEDWTRFYEEEVN